MRGYFAAAVVAVGFATSAGAATFTMDYATLGTAGGANASGDGTSYSEDGMTMTAVGHFDRFKFHPNLSPDNTDFNPVIHEGNNGSAVNFSMGGTAFDLLSIDVIGWWWGNNPALTTSVTFSSNAGGNFVLNASAAGPNFSGLIDFSTKANFGNITSFSIQMPNPGATCTIAPVLYNCPNFAFDNVTFRTPPAAPIPLPAGGVLLLSALGLAAVFRRRT